MSCRHYSKSLSWYYVTMMGFFVIALGNIIGLNKRSVKYTLTIILSMLFGSTIQAFAKEKFADFVHWDSLRGDFNGDHLKDIILSKYDRDEGKFCYKVLLKSNGTYISSKSHIINDDFSYLLDGGMGDVMIYRLNVGFGFGIRISCCGNLREYEDYIYIYDGKSKDWVLTKKYEYSYVPRVSFSATYYKDDTVNHLNQLNVLVEMAKRDFPTKNQSLIQDSINNIFILGELVQNIELNKQSVAKLNDLAYYLERTEQGDLLASFLLEEIIKKFPNRTVAYINLGDAYWGLGQEDKVKEAYRAYVQQMKDSGKEARIPTHVRDRLK